MEKKYLLMLGAGFMQKPAIESAKNLGWHVTAVDGNPHALCASLADDFIPVDLKDIPALEDCARQLRAERGLDAVFTAGTDFSASVAFIAEKLSLPGHGYEAACNATDKVRMRKCFAAAGVPSPQSAEFSAAVADTFEAFLVKGGNESGLRDEFVPFFSGFPLVVKPVDNMGARGCRLVRSAAELLAASRDAVAYSRSGRAIVEEYMDGPEFSVDALVRDGKIIVCGFADRHIYYPPYFIEMGHTMSSSVDEKTRAQLLHTFEKAVRALGLTHGAAKGDIKLTPQGPMIGEIAARLSGGYMSGWTFPYAAATNLTEQALLLAAGCPVPLFENKLPVKISALSGSLFYLEPQSSSAERAWLSIPGTVKTVYGSDKAKQVAGVKDVFPRAGENDRVVFPVNNVEKCGNIIAAAPERAQAAFAAEEAARRIVVRLEAPNRETEAFLSAGGEFPPDAYGLASPDREALAALSASMVDLSQPLAGQLPPFLHKYLDGPADWNRKTLRYALAQFEELAAKKGSVNAAVFWKALIRGGVQGALYVADLRAC